MWQGSAGQPDRYDERFGFVSHGGAVVLGWLDPRPGERVVDIGCGTGDLAAQVAARGAVVVGVDVDADMVAAARRKHPGPTFVQRDAHEVTVDDVGGPADAVFSNAALHWLHEPDRALAALAGLLRPGGRLVLEMGGAGNVAALVGALAQARAELGLAGWPRLPWWFPTPGEAATALERRGLVVRRLELVDRPTPLGAAEDALGQWFSMFGDGLLAGVPADRVDAVLALATAKARPVLWDGGGWTADYVRLRVSAVRRSPVAAG